MNEDEFMAMNERSIIQCPINALESVNKMELPKVVAISNDSFSGLTPKIQRVASKKLEDLSEIYGEELPYLFGLSLHEIWFSLFNNSCFIALMVAEGGILDNDEMQKLATPEGYGDVEGFGDTIGLALVGTAESQQQATFRDGTPFRERPPIGDILKGAALYWFAAAANSLRAGDLQAAFDWLREAQDTLRWEHGDYMWNAGANPGGEPAMENSAIDLAAARTLVAREAARKRHMETRIMKADVFVWLDANRLKFKSMEAAAAEIIKQQPIVFRTASEWGAEWKKLRSASKP
jgi:hypothetical protein